MIVKKTLLAALTLAALVIAHRTSLAQQDSAAQDAQAAAKPVVAFAVSGYDEIMADADFLGSLSGTPLKQMLESAIQDSPAAAAIDGIDRTRPCGFVLQTDGEEFPRFAFLPVTDLSKILSSLEPMIGEPIDAGDGILEIDVEEQTVYLKEIKGWAFMAQSPDVLANVPDDPMKLIAGLNGQYDLAVRVHVANVPQQMRQMIMMPIMMGMQAGMQQREDEGDEQYALRTKLSQQAIENIQRMLNELDTLTIGAAVDRDAATASLEFSVTALEGTKYAEQMAASTKMPSDFAGFALPGAAFTLNGVGTISPSEAEQAKSNIGPLRASALKELENQGLSGDDLDRAKRIVDDLFDVLNSMIDGGRVDVGMSLVLGADAVTYVAGAGVGDTAKLDALIKSLADEVVKEKPETADMIKLNAAEHDGVRYHVISVPTLDMAADLPNLPNLVGKTLDVVIGIGTKNAYVAVGRDAMSTLNEAIDSSKAKASEPILPMRMTLAGTSIAKFVALVAREDSVKAVATKVAEMLEESEGKDHLIVTSTPIPMGGKVRIELEKGILKVLSSIPSLVQEQDM